MNKNWNARESVDYEGHVFRCSTLISIFFLFRWTERWVKSTWQTICAYWKCHEIVNFHIKLLNLPIFKMNKTAQNWYMFVFLLHLYFCIKLQINITQLFPKLVQLRDLKSQLISNNPSTTKKNLVIISIYFVNSIPSIHLLIW